MYSEAQALSSSSSTCNVVAAGEEEGGSEKPRCHVKRNSKSSHGEAALRWYRNQWRTTPNFQSMWRNPKHRRQQGENTGEGSQTNAAAKPPYRAKATLRYDTSLQLLNANHLVPFCPMMNLTGRVRARTCMGMYWGGQACWESLTLLKGLINWQYTGTQGQALLIAFTTKMAVASVAMI